jgi:hypothetical protein
VRWNTGDIFLCGGRFISGLGKLSWLLAKPKPAVRRPKACSKHTGYRAAKALASLPLPTLASAVTLSCARSAAPEREPVKIET